MHLYSGRFCNFYKYKRKLQLFAQTLITQQRGLITPAEQWSVTHVKPLKILFFGTDNFSLPSLVALYGNQHARTENSQSDRSCLGVVTSFKSPANCVRSYAEQKRLPLYRWPVTAAECKHYDLGIVVSFGHLIPADIIKQFRLGMINVHASLLPRWRGAAPIIYAIMHGDVKTGVSIMKIEPNHFDIGDILAQCEVSIKKNMFMPELHEELSKKGANLLVDVVNGFPHSFANITKQDNEFATYAPKIAPNITEVIWSNLNAIQLHNRYRALYSFKYLNTKFAGKNIQLVKLALPSTTAVQTSKLMNAVPGSFVYERDRKCLVICCADNSFIEVYQLRVEGKKVMSAADFNNGFLKKLESKDHLFLSNKSVTC